MGQPAGLYTPHSDQQHLPAEEDMPSPELGGCPEGPGLLWMACGAAPALLSVSPDRGYAPNRCATPRRGCETLISVGLAKRKKRIMGSADVRVGDPCWMISLRTLSSEPELCLRRQHRKSQDHQCQAEGLGMKLSFPRCNMGTDTTDCLLLGLG